MNILCYANMQHVFLCVYMGVHALGFVGRLMTCKVRDTPPETLKAPHIPLVKVPGVVLNVCTRPVLVESGVHRQRQRVAFRRIQHAVTPSTFCEAQYAIVKGVAPTQWRRHLYAIFLQKIREREPVAALMLDQSNAYGQTDLGALGF